MPVSGSHQAWVEDRLASLRTTNPTALLSQLEFYESFWNQAANGPDQLRQRVKLALSEIFVISFVSKQIDVRGLASYYDLLGRNAFGNYRTLLEQVSLHPMMGIYLSAMANIKEDPTTGRHPDENYAREIQQLMSTGLYQLNQDGTQKQDASGAPIPTYTMSDIQGLSKVFTGFSWWHPNPTSGGGNPTFLGGFQAPDSVVTPMIPYPYYHSISEKTFLGVTIPASSTPDASGDLKIALDTIFNNPNVGPFIGKQLIQRLVTSNPSKEYVARISAVFNDNGQGVRGDLGAVVKAILLDPEARDPANMAAPRFGKIREPVVRLANWMRAFNAYSNSGIWNVGSTSQPTVLGQSPLNAQTVFNFFRPGFSPPGTITGGAGDVAPEFQIINEVSAAGYLNTMQTAIGSGIGAPTLVGTVKLPDVQSKYTNEVAIAASPQALVDRVNLLLMYGQMSAGLKARILESVASVRVPAPTGTNQAQVTTALTNRSKLAAFLTFASPEYLAQR
jgi:uncharacterized protein (DUF1800 family)